MTLLLAVSLFAVLYENEGSDAEVFPSTTDLTTIGYHTITIGDPGYPEGYYYIEAWGGDGGAGGKGEQKDTAVQSSGGTAVKQAGLYYFTPGTTIEVYIGSAGESKPSGDFTGSGIGGAGGTNGYTSGNGGNGGEGFSYGTGLSGAGGGGGAGTFVLSGGSVVLVSGGGAGGGGGAGNQANWPFTNFSNGGNGGNGNGGNGTSGGEGGGSGATTYNINFNGTNGNNGGEAALNAPGGGGGGGGGGYNGGNGGNGGSSGMLSTAKGGGGGKGGNNYLTGNETIPAGFTEPANSRTNGTNGQAMITYLGGYEITFQPNNGDPIQTEYVPAGLYVHKPVPDPTRTGYTFAEWFTDDGTFLDEWDFSTRTPGSDMPLYAKWTPRKVTVDFMRNYSSSDTTIHETISTGDYGKTLSVSPATSPTRDGYTFTVWYKDQGCTTPWVFASDLMIDTNGVTNASVSPELKLYAGWAPKTVAVTYIRNYDASDTTVHDTGSGSYGGLLTAPTAPERAGYDFGGWFWDQPCATTAWNFGATQLTTANHVSGADTNSPELVLYAKWTLKTVAVSYIRNYSNTDTAVIDTDSGDYGTMLTAPATPSYTGYDFGGWFKESACTNEWIFGTYEMTEANGVQNASTTPTLTLYAKWTGKTVAVTYMRNYDASDTTYTTGSGSYGGLLTAPTALDRPGYNFGGWFIDQPCLTTAWNFGSTQLTNGNGVTGEATPTPELVLYAKWTLKTVSVFFKNNTSSTDTSNFDTYTTPLYGDSLTAPSPDPIRTGYTFDGWFKNQACTNVWDFGSDTLTDTNGVSGANTATPMLNLYAKWIAKTYSVTLDDNGGSGGSGTATATFGSLIPHVAIPVNTGYYFNGYENSGGKAYIDFRGNGIIQWDVDGAATLYAQWTLTPPSPDFFITPTSDVGSTIDPSVMTKVSEHSDLTFTFEALSGFHISSVTVDGTPLSLAQIISGTYTFTDIMDNHNIDVRSAVGPRISDVELTITIKQGKGHAEYSVDDGVNFVVYDKSVIIPQGTDIVIIAYEDDGYEFVRWETPSVWTNPEISFPNAAGAIDLDLYFKAEGSSEPFTFNFSENFIILLVIILLIIAALIAFFLSRRSYAVEKVGSSGSIVGNDKARRKKPYTFKVEGGSGTVSYRVGEDGQWKDLTPNGKGEYVIPKEDVIDKLMIEHR